VRGWRDDSEYRRPGHGPSETGRRSYQPCSGAVRRQFAARAYYDAVNAIFRGPFANASAGAGGSNGQIQYNNNGALSGFAVSGIVRSLPHGNYYLHQNDGGSPRCPRDPERAGFGRHPEQRSSTTGNAATATALGRRHQYAGPGRLLSGYWQTEMQPGAPPR